MEDHNDLKEKVEAGEEVHVKRNAATRNELCGLHDTMLIVVFMSQSRRTGVDGTRLCKSHLAEQAHRWTLLLEYYGAWLVMRATPDGSSSCSDNSNGERFDWLP